MKFNPDDPKWTAYVLGELSEAERQELEKELESSAIAREAIEEIRLTTALLKDELAKEEPIGLSAGQKRTIAVATHRERPRPFFRWTSIAAAVAAGVLIVATISIQPLLRSRQSAVEPASSATSTAPATEPSQIAEADAKNARESREKDSSRLQTAQSGNVRPLKDQALQGQQSQQAQQGLQFFKQVPQEGQQGGASRPAYVLPPQAAPTPPFAGAGGAIGLGSNSFVERKTLAITPPAAAAPPALADRADRTRSNTEAYDFISDNPFIRVTQDSLATFSIDVDTASYANIRRFLSMNQLPPKDSVRIEEMINYFSYDYASPAGGHPIAAYTEVAAAPWKPDHRLVRIGIKAKDVDVANRPPSNLVFLIDVSGSMATPEKLPMLKNAMKLMVERLGEGDHVAIVTYAGASGLRLPSTTGDKKEIINSGIDSLNAGGSTNGASGIQLAYETAVSNFIRGGINRVVLATDGDFNVGVTSQGDLIRIIEEKAKSGVFLSVLGFGMGNYKDSTLEKLADKGNGNYAYIDTLNEARKVLVEEMSATFLTVAKDVKIQVEFNPAEVNAYRLIGYENRALRHEDFNDDKKDAGDMGAGQSVTALFEVVPNGVEIQIPGVDPLKYQQRVQPAQRAPKGEVLNLRIRYKDPQGDSSQLMETPVMDRGTAFNNAGVDFRFAASVASFGMILRDSPYKGQSSLDAVLDMAEKSKGADKNGYREEFARLVRKTRALKEIQ